jgi:hypothetical protein
MGASRSKGLIYACSMVHIFYSIVTKVRRSQWPNREDQFRLLTKLNLIEHNLNYTIYLN